MDFLKHEFCFDVFFPFEWSIDVFVDKRLIQNILKTLRIAAIVVLL